MSVRIAVTKDFLNYALERNECYSHVQFRDALEAAGWRTQNPNTGEAVRLITKRSLAQGKLMLCSDPEHARMGRVRLPSPDPLGDHRA